jgi:methylase of polypeptide subunit release factors
MMATRCALHETASPPREADAVLNLHHRLRAWWGLHRTRRVRVGQHTIEVPPGVLDPVLFRAGAWLADRVAAECGARPPMRVLDLGCGTGVVGVLAQAAGADVVASDLDPRACRAARENGVRDVRRGDLFEAVADERFDLIAFNPPFLPGRPQDHPLGRALFGGSDLAVLRRFSATVDAHLSSTGSAWVVLSDRAPGAAAALGAGWQMRETTSLAGEMLGLWSRPHRTG